MSPWWQPAAFAEGVATSVCQTLTLKPVPRSWALLHSWHLALSLQGGVELPSSYWVRLLTLCFSPWLGLKVGHTYEVPHALHSLCPISQLHFRFFKRCGSIALQTSALKMHCFVFRRLWMVGNAGGKKGKLFTAMSFCKITALLKGKLKPCYIKIL